MMVTHKGASNLKCVRVKQPPGLGLGSQVLGFFRTQKAASLQAAEASEHTLNSQTCPRDDTVRSHQTADWLDYPSRLGCPLKTTFLRNGSHETKQEIQKHAYSYF